MKIVLLGLEFNNENLGCQALSYSFLNIFQNVLENRKCEYVAVTFNSFDKISCDFGANVRCITIHYKSINFWREIYREFKSSNLIVDFTGGDSFSDIYGSKRFILASAIKQLAISSGTPFMLGPQTYGPFARRSSRLLAKKIVKGSEYVFARDDISGKYAEQIGRKKVTIVTDVAFSLPYEKANLELGEKKKIGINISGLLWNGGYSYASLPLAVNYQEYCRTLIKELTDSGNYTIYLIPHVGTMIEHGEESDLRVCRLLQREYPKVVVIDNLSTPMEAKSYISAMDVFIGARMHATIASFSSGVATIPFSYSRKFEGLFSFLNYKYVLGACSLNTKDAVKLTMEWIEDSDILANSVEESLKKVEKLKAVFIDSLRNIVNDID